MSEPAWVALGGGAIDYVGGWAAGTAYKPGDVVRHNGIEYLAVNPSTAQTPPVSGASGIGTTLPVSPADGDEFILVDSLTAPTYQWRFKYLASKATNRWLFIGGSPAYHEIVAGEATTSVTYVALTTPVPSLTAPVTGDYLVTIGFRCSAVAAAVSFGMSYDIGAAPAVEDNYIGGYALNSIHFFVGVERARRHSLVAGTTLVAKYRVAAATSASFANRIMRLQPIAVGG